MIIKRKIFSRIDLLKNTIGAGAGGALGGAMIGEKLGGNRGIFIGGSIGGILGSCFGLYSSIKDRKEAAELKSKEVSGRVYKDLYLKRLPREYFIINDLCNKIDNIWFEDHYIYPRGFILDRNENENPLDFDQLPIFCINKNKEFNDYYNKVDYSIIPDFIEYNFKKKLWISKWSNGKEKRINNIKLYLIDLLKFDYDLLNKVESSDYPDNNIEIKEIIDQFIIGIKKQL